MQDTMKHQYADHRVLVFPSTEVFRVRGQVSAIRTRFERGLIFVLLTLWAIGMVAWTLFSVVGLSYEAGSATLATIPAPSSLPTLQSAAIFAVRLLLGF